MKIRRILENKFGPYKEPIESWEEWVSIRDSGKYNPQLILSDLTCDYTGVTSTKPKLYSLVGSPTWIGGNLYCSNVGLKSLKGAPAHIDGSFYCNSNKLISLKNIHKQIKYIGDEFSIIKTPIKSNILGLLLIDKLKHVNSDDKVFNIINTQLQSTKDVLECQEELISAGYKDFAKL